ncbi:integral membrane protein GPR155 [Clonorchis sinensis]|uniref:Integral membrane protein GPR155 n=1 Tax=Clonorchis sinensis TaxID=79923 RepID=H2KST4_CLOSI|nr:integral membrane protein GPR155 [Clonorchis sinensis]
MPDYTKTDAIDELIPALIQCFGVILLGYLAGRYKILREAEIRGLNSYVTKFALPAVFFKGMVTVDLTGVSWALVGAISLGKATVFFLAFATTLLLNRTSPFGMAAILSMFVSQSNDVALGYPVLKALYPELAIYVYLFAPAQLIILNPIAYLFLEWHQLKQESIDAEVKRLADGTDITPPASVSKYKRLLQVIWRVALNPLFFMTVIGVIFNFILSHNIPIYVDGLLRIIAESFAATALFTLGFGMVGKMGQITQREMLVLVSILMVKLVILPFINRELVVLLVPSPDVNETLRYSTFGFLYGAIPTAPPVYLFAAQYHVLPVVKLNAKSIENVNLKRTRTKSASDKYTRLHANLVLTGGSSESLVYDILQLIVPPHVSLGVVFEISHHVFTKETTRKVAGNSLTGHDRFCSPSDSSDARVSVNFVS